MSIASEITRLQGAKADIKSSIEAKGVSVPSSATLDDYSDYIDSISGGGSLPTSVNELAELIVNGIDNINAIPNSYPTYTSNNLTLYTPATDFETYAIYKRTDGTYRIAWFQKKFLLGIVNSASGLDWYLLRCPTTTTSYSWGSYVTTYQTTSIVRIATYLSSGYSSIDDCIQAIQSNATAYTYSSSTYLSFALDTPYLIPYSNGIIYNASVDPTIIIETQRLSQNETIEVIPTT